MGNLYKYICQFPKEIEKEILNDVKQALQDLDYEININEEIENARNSKLCDLSDTIDIKKYI